MHKYCPEEELVYGRLLLRLHSPGSRYQAVVGEDVTQSSTTGAGWRVSVERLTRVQPGGMAVEIAG